MPDQQTNKVNLGDLWEKFHSQPAEISVIGALLYDNANMENITELVCADDFVTPELSEIFSVIQAGWRSGQVTDPVTLPHRLADYHDGDHKAAGAFLMTLVDSAAFGPEILDYARQIRDLSNRRKLADIHQEGLGRTGDFNRDTTTLVERTEKALRELSAHSGDHWKWQAADKIDVENVLAPADISELVPTGWSSLDAKLGGWVRGAPNVIAARPSMGKSIVGVEVARNVAQQGIGVGFFSLEMSAKALWRRMACSKAFTGKLYSGEYDTPYYSRIRNGEETPERLRAAEEALEALRGLPIQIDERSGLKVSEMHRWMRRLARYYERRNMELGVVIVDHIQKIAPEKERRGNPVAEMTDISGALMESAKELNVALVELCQLNRSVEHRTDKRPQLSDLRESGAIEQDAEIVIGLHRPWYYLDRMMREGEELNEDQLDEMKSKKWFLEMDILKNREGQTGRVDMFCAPGANHIANLASGDRYHERDAA